MVNPCCEWHQHNFEGFLVTKMADANFEGDGDVAHTKNLTFHLNLYPGLKDSCRIYSPYLGIYMGRQTVSAKFQVYLSPEHVVPC